MRVYHLMSAEYGLSDIALKRIRISRFNDVNDPFELLAVNVGSSKHFRKALATWKRDLNSSKGLLSFSSHWESPVLWSHFAAKHHGLCLGFDLDDSLAMPVRYSTERIRTRFPESGDPKDLDEVLIDSLLYTKYEHWSYEEEIRVFVDLDPHTLEGGSYFCSFSPSLALREVILGPLCEVPHKEVADLTSKLYDHVTVRKARLAFKWFKVVPDERFERG